MTNRLSIFVCVVFSSLFLVILVRAQVPLRYTVRNTSDVIVPGACGNGLGTGTIDCSLRGAIQAVNVNGGVIFFSIPSSDPNCITGVCVIILTSALPDLSVNNSFISGPGADKVWVLRNTGSFRIFNVTAAGTVGISGITLGRGANVNDGGGIAVGSGTTLNVTKCVIRDNSASIRGGGIYNSGGTVNITDSTISGGFAVTGGGIYIASGTVNVTNSTLSDNRAGSSGGAIYNFGTLNVTNTTINGNTLTFTSGIGGGIGNEGTLNVTNSTISSNGGGNGGGVFTQTGTATVKNTVIAANTAQLVAPDVSGNFVSAGFNLIGKTDGSGGFSAPTDQTGTSGAPLNPMLDPAGLQNNGGPTMTRALLPGSPAIDKGTSNGLTGGLATDQRGGVYRRTFNISTVPNAPGGNATDIGAFELQSRSPADLDGDGKTDVGIFRPSVGEWWSYRSSTGATFATQFGQSIDRITPGDFTGDNKADIAFWRPSTGFWFILRSETFTFFSFPFGTNGDIPAPANFDGDAVVDAAVFRPSTATWFYINSFSGGTVVIVPFGANGDVPVPGDYDGDGNADIAIYRPSVGQWWINFTAGGVMATTFGGSSDKPVQGDYTGDGKTDIAFWRPSTGEWFVLRSEDFSFFSFTFGMNGDIPAPGDYDGDGKHDATIFRPSTATWFSNRTSTGTLIQQFGINGDRPIPSAFVP